MAIRAMRSAAFVAAAGRPVESSPQAYYFAGAAAKRYRASGGRPASQGRDGGAGIESGDRRQKGLSPARPPRTSRQSRSRPACLYVAAGTPPLL